MKVMPLMSDLLTYYHYEEGLGRHEQERMVSGAAA